MPERVGFISTRFAGTDGVSLESAKWAEVLWMDRHTSHWYAGRLDRDPGASLCVPEAYFQHPENLWIERHVWGRNKRDPKLTRRIRDLSEYLKATLYDFVARFDISLLIIENALTIPMHIPLGVAITEFLGETDTPAIAHHHDFYWERSRFQISCVPDYLEMAFPPREPSLQHVVINQAAREELAWRKGVPSVVIPNVFNFQKPPSEPDGFAADIRGELGLGSEDRVILQPTRVVPRKGIEHAVSLLRYLRDPHCKLVISHESGDEGGEYTDQLVELAQDEGIDLRLIGHRIADRRREANGDSPKIYVLQDLYPLADLVTFPSLYEGFGNAFLEAIYYRLPIVVNRYPVYVRDIEPKGFQVPVMDGFVSRRLVNEVRRILDDPDYRQAMVDHNYAVAGRHYSYAALRSGLQGLINNIDRGG